MNLQSGLTVCLSRLGCGPDVRDPYLDGAHFGARSATAAHPGRAQRRDAHAPAGGDDRVAGRGRLRLDAPRPRRSASARACRAAPRCTTFRASRISSSRRSRIWPRKNVAAVLRRARGGACRPMPTVIASDRRADRPRRPTTFGGPLFDGRARAVGSRRAPTPSCTRLADPLRAGRGPWPRVSSGATSRAIWPSIRALRRRCSSSPCTWRAAWRSRRSCAATTLRGVDLLERLAAARRARVARFHGLSTKPPEGESQTWVARSTWSESG